ncbi:hypothetical protein CWI38_1074p0020 [Hamiltosporidium tvaerminnensis]|uniref:Telomeric single stranded DNA binding POT1/Cdc13 domain-containing protein n=1 Tax=Hamiltosporidium tvaerminnensis TaxID=1176355 RepID=A0A4Q9LVM5_9MICR|nr:hypothetical protein CWI38_1074p0020 [Hamiltosporidium tvaerminnensis]
MKKIFEEKPFLQIKATNKTFLIEFPKNLIDTFNQAIDDEWIQITGIFILEKYKITITNDSKIEYTKYQIKKYSNPTDYVALNKMEMNKYCNVIGIVVGYLEPKQSKGSDWVSTIIITDESMETNKIFVKIFSKTPLFPFGFNNGDIIKIKNIKLIKPNIAITGKQNEVKLIYNFFTNNLYTENIYEENRITCLRNIYLENNQKYVRQLKICDLKETCYFDFCGLLINRQIEKNNLVILTLIDYTVNCNIKNVICDEEFANNMILYVKAWDKHAEMAKSLEINEIYLFKNLRLSDKDFILIAHMSELRKCTILNVDNGHVLRQSIYQEQEIYKESFLTSILSNDEIPYGLSSLQTVPIYNIKISGLHRIKATVKFHFPFGILCLYFCRACKLTDINKNSIEEHVFQNSNCNIDKINICRFILKDTSGSCVALCRGKILEYFFRDENFSIHSTKPLDILIMSVSSDEGFKHHILDAIFDIKNSLSL